MSISWLYFWPFRFIIISVQLSTFLSLHLSFVHAFPGLILVYWFRFPNMFHFFFSGFFGACVLLLQYVDYSCIIF